MKHTRKCAEEAIAIARIQPKGEHYENCKNALLKLQSLTMQESGCLEFDIFETSNESNTLYLFERFENQEKRDVHLSYDYTKEVITSYKSWLASDIQVVSLSRIV